MCTKVNSSWKLRYCGDVVSCRREADGVTLAVLPFRNISDDREQEFFADGITEDIISALSRFRWLLVIARNSSFTFRQDTGRTRGRPGAGRALCAGGQHSAHGSARRERVGEQPGRRLGLCGACDHDVRRRSSAVPARLRTLPGRQSAFGPGPFALRCKRNPAGRAGAGPGTCRAVIETQPARYLPLHLLRDQGAATDSARTLRGGGRGGACLDRRTRELPALPLHLDRCIGDE